MATQLNSKKLSRERQILEYDLLLASYSTEAGATSKAQRLEQKLEKLNKKLVRMQ